MCARYLLDGVLLCVVAWPEVDTEGVDDQLAVVRVRDVVHLPAVRSELLACPRRLDVQN